MIPLLPYGADWGWFRVLWHAARRHDVGMVANGWACYSCVRVW